MLGIHFILIRFIWIRIRILDLSCIKINHVPIGPAHEYFCSFLSPNKMSRIFTCFENFIIYYFNNLEVFGFRYFILQICVLIAISCFFDVLLIEWGLVYIHGSGSRELLLINESVSRELNCWSMDPDPGS